MSELDYWNARLLKGAISRREFMGRAAALGASSVAGSTMLASADARADDAQAELTLTFGGDVNFTSSRETPQADEATKGGRVMSFQSVLAGIADLIDGDLNFANLETVVTDRSDLPDTGGRFVFSTHPKAVETAISAGINLFSLANNHAGDHGPEGMLETLRNMDDLARHHHIYYSGLGLERDQVLTPKVFTVSTQTGQYVVAFLAMTAISNTPSQAGDNRLGVAYIQDKRDFDEAMRRMAAVRADYKILSVHGGTEGSITVDGWQRTLYRQALVQGDIDLVLGAHPHRVRPADRVGEKLIFYSLGNYAMLGAANINGGGVNMDYGLLGKVYLDWNANRTRLVAKAAEAIPLVDMHISPHKFNANEGYRRIQALNGQASSQLGSSALLFAPDSNGEGSVCLSDEGRGPRAELICQKLQSRSQASDKISRP